MSKYELMVIDNGTMDFKSKSMDSYAQSLIREINEIEGQLEYEHTGMMKALHKSAFEFPDTAAEMRTAFNRVFELRAKLAKTKPRVVPDDIDPVTDRNEEDDMDPVAELIENQKEQQDNTEIEAMKATPDGKELERRCKRVFRRISKLTHPDMTPDKSLHEVFAVAKAAMNDWNLEMLERIFQDVKRYVKVRKTNKNFQAYLEDIIRKKKQQLNAALIKKAQWHNTSGYKVFKARSGNKAARHRAYKRFVFDQIQHTLEEIAQLEAQLAHQEEQERAAKSRSSFLSKFTLSSN